MSSIHKQATKVTQRELYLREWPRWALQFAQHANDCGTIISNTSIFGGRQITLREYLQECTRCCVLLGVELWQQVHRKK